MIRRACLFAIVVAAASCTDELEVLRPDEGVCLGASYACDAPEDCCSGLCEASMCVAETPCRETDEACETDEECCSELCAEGTCVDPPTAS